MKTIKALINDELMSRVSKRRTYRDQLVEDIYYEYPELERMDDELRSLRGSRMLSLFDGIEEPVKAIITRENELNKERDAFIHKNNINPYFDEEQWVCSKCKDTGFVAATNGVNVVCGDCMKSQLDECFESSGMADYTSYKLNGFNANHFGNKAERLKQFSSMKKLFEVGTDNNPVRLLISQPQSGKTFLSVIITKYAIVEGKSAYFLKAEDLRISSDELKTDLKGCDMLIVDDYSPDLTRNWIIASSLNSILEARIAANRPVVIVSSSSKEELIAGSDERIALKIKRADLI